MKRTMMLAAMAVALVTVFGVRAAAVEIHELNGSDLGLGVGARGISMGGAFTALADDSSALFSNPAGISQLKKSEAMLMVDVNPTRYSFKSLVLRPKSWQKSKANWAFGISRTNRLKYIADGDWSQGHASHLIDLSMINVERDYVGGLNSRTHDTRYTLAGQIPNHPNLKLGFSYINFTCTTTFYGQGAGRICQTVAYNAVDFGALYQDNKNIRFGMALRNPFEKSKPRYLDLGAAWFKGQNTFTLDIERIFGQYGNDRKQVRFLMIRSGVEHDMGGGWKLRGGIIIPVKAWTSTLGNIRANLPSPKFGGAVGAGYTWRDTTLDFAIFGDPGKSYIKSKKTFGGVFTVKQQF